MRRAPALAARLAARDLVDPHVEHRRRRAGLQQLEEEGELPPARAERERVGEPHARTLRHAQVASGAGHCRCQARGELRSQQVRTGASGMAAAIEPVNSSAHTRHAFPLTEKSVWHRTSPPARVGSPSGRGRRHAGRPVPAPAHGTQRHLARGAAGQPRRDRLAATGRARRRPGAGRGVARDGALHARARRRHGWVPRALRARPAHRSLGARARRLPAAAARDGDAGRRARGLRPADRGAAGARARARRSRARAATRRSRATLSAVSRRSTSAASGWRSRARRRSRGSRRRSTSSGCATMRRRSCSSASPASAGSARGRSG